MKILIAEDDRNLRKVLSAELSVADFKVSEADNGIRAKELLEKEEHDVLLLDLNMPGMGGMEVLNFIKEAGISTEVIVFTGNATVATAVDAMKMGAYDYISKPFQIHKLISVIEKAHERKSLRSENLALKSQIRRQSEAPEIITRSPLMLEILENIKKFAVSDLPVLVCGESGSGKELIARAVHDASGRKDALFLPINCGAIPETMLESELFGHEKGAFTGAHARKAGLLEIANHGTLFLDEISELNLQLQGKILRAIETGSFFRVGGTSEVRVDVRYLSATNKDIMKEIEEKNFRQDLFYRISTFTVHIPPLRERREDIPLIVEHIIRNNPAFKNRKLSRNALEILSEYSWPGNVRELQNVIQRALFLSRNDNIDSIDLPFDLISRQNSSAKRLEDVEREHILQVFREVNAHKKKAAEILGIDPKTLYRKLSHYGISLK
jgi:DNA-binding NtrC family response regulator